MGEAREALRNEIEDLASAIRAANETFIRQAKLATIKKRLLKKA